MSAQKDSSELQLMFDLDETIQQIPVSNLPNQEQQLMKDLMNMFFPVIQVNEYKPINGKTDVDVSKYTN